MLSSLPPSLLSAALRRCIAVFALLTLVALAASSVHAQQPHQQQHTAAAINQWSESAAAPLSSDAYSDETTHLQWQRHQLNEQQRAQMAQAQERFLQQQLMDAYQQQQQQPYHQQQRSHIIHPDGSSITTLARAEAPSPSRFQVNQVDAITGEDDDGSQGQDPTPFKQPDPLQRDDGGRRKKGEKSPSSEDPTWRRQCNDRCDERTMDATGVGVHAVASTHAEVKATVEFRKLVNTTLTGGELPADELRFLIGTVQTEVSHKAAEVVGFLLNGTFASSISKLRTSSVGLEPLYEYVNNRQMLMGYRASNSITFRVLVAVAGQVIDAIVERGVTRIDGVSFFASPKVLNAARHIAIEKAVQDAIGQAMSALSGLGQLVSTDKRDLQIIRMDITGVTRPEAENMMSVPPSPRAEALMSKSYAFRSEGFGDAGFSPVEGDEKTVGATVTMKVRF